MHSHNKKEVKDFMLGQVLILVLMEDALAHYVEGENKVVFVCLNPCFNGRCTRTNLKTVRLKMKTSVLILVLMEDALAQLKSIEQKA